ncbi:MAG TPA: M23 family metallopeptidase [Allosphingosinicella sp.]
MRRLTVGRRAQAAATGAVLGLLAWSGYATAQYATAMTSDVATMQRQVSAMQSDVEALRAAAAERAQVLEQRQAFLTEMLSGDADPAEMARLLPAAANGDIEDPRVAAEFEQVDGAQMMLAAQADAATRERYRRTAHAVRQLGIDPRRLSQGGVGGPFEEAAGSAATTANADVDPRFAQLFASWRQTEQLERGVASIPSMMPVQGARWTSSFGVRSDPFRGRAAMHGGIDMAGPVGTPIYATADGTVAAADWNSGGYGNLVELGHGAGIATRYGHLSRIMVRSGERVRRGQVIGLMGSTGRSTGSHLHYEVRIDGRAVNPLPFLQSGQALASLQSSGGQGGSR